MRKEHGKKWCGKTWITSHELRVISYGLKALMHELKFKSAILNPQVMGSNPRVQESLNQQKLK